MEVKWGKEDGSYKAAVDGIPAPPAVIDEAAIAWFVLGKAQEALILEQIRYAGEIQPIGPGDRRFSVAVPASITIFEFLAWLRILKPFIDFVQQVQNLPAGETATSPELPFPIPFSGKTLGLSLNVKALS